MNKSNIYLCKSVHLLELFKISAKMLRTASACSDAEENSGKSIYKGLYEIDTNGGFIY